MVRHKDILALTLVMAGALTMMYSWSASAQSLGGNALALMQDGQDNKVLVKDIKIEGAERIEAETIKSYLQLGKNDAVTAEKMNNSFKALYGTGLFSDVRIGMQGDVLWVRVTENPIINKVIFEGTDVVSEEDLTKEVKLRPRLVYTQPKVEKDVQRILDIYRRDGYFSAMVEAKLIKRDQNRVDLIFEVHEGKRTGVRHIAFIGNQKYDDDTLRSAINTRESAWWRFLSTVDYYDPDRLNYDRELLRKFYLNEGYMDFRIDSSVAELTPDRQDFFMTFTVEEGARYKVGKVEIKTEIKGMTTDDLQEYLAMKSGGWYSAESVEKTIAALTAALGDKQYAFVNILPDTKKDKDTHTVDVVFTIKSSQRIYVDRINITGNSQTVDKVIRRQISMAEGDPFSTTKLNESQQRLRDLGYFSNVDMKPSQGVQPDRANIDTAVKEKSTGQVSVGAGFSSTDGPLGNFNISEHNFMGEGQDVRLGATISGITNQFDLGWTDPYFLDRDLAAGADIFYKKNDNQQYSSYTEESRGFNLRLGYPLATYLRQRVNYTFHVDTIGGLASNASWLVQQQQGTFTTSDVGQGLVYDRRNSRLRPTKGYLVTLDTDVAGLGGTEHYFRARSAATQYIPLAEDWILSINGEAGQIWGLAGPTRITDRFFIGGSNLRGFAYAGVGPRELTLGSNNDALGGDRFARGTAELEVPLPVPKEFGLRGYVFSDAGLLDHSDEKPQAGQVFVDNSYVRLSAGVGIGWDSPFGPIRLDWAKALRKESYDKLQTINFSFGSRF